LYVALLKRLDTIVAEHKEDDTYISYEEAKKFQNAMITLFQFCIGGQRAQFIYQLRMGVHFIYIFELHLTLYRISVRTMMANIVLHLLFQKRSTAEKSEKEFHFQTISAL
jgi:hypothetical protein